MRLVDSARYQQLKETGLLPSPKGVALAIVKLLQDDDFQIAELARLVKSDPAIAGRILKFVNAAAMGIGRPVASLNNAVVILGAYRIRNLVLSFSLLDRHRSGRCDAFDYERYWSRALATAIAAQALAKYAKIPADENFTAGLLCDVGELALAALFPTRYGAVRSAAAEDPARLLAAELAAFDCDHRQLGASMMAEWGLPQVLVAAAYHCETPDAGGHPDGSRILVLSLVLNFARALAEVCVATADSWVALPELYNKAARLGIAPDDLGAIVDDIVGRWREWGQMLKLTTRDLPHFADLLSALAAASLRGGPAAEAERRNLLLISDAGRGSDSLAEQLQALGYAVTRAARGGDAALLAIRENIALILIDTATPEIDGLVFCTAFNAGRQDRDCYVILVGVPREEPSLIRAVDGGADDYLLRPVSLQTLRTRVHAAEKMVQLKQEIRRERRSAIHSADQWASTHRRLVDAAMNDPLTRLPNRRHGFDFLTAEWTFARSHGRPLCCMMIDADHFKAINDRYGHDAGDAVLVGLAELACSQLRIHDLIFRFGGEEFYMVCPGADLANGLAVAERIRSGIEAATFRYGDVVIPVTVSIGVATFRDAHGAAEDLIRDADAALYRAKQNGRNRIES